ncbi:BTAD domain-containing putative transcriptional regulator [Thiohalorhabdus methylotrophus]|uniref:BTAD domain-containing putative transcriptional regulator n=1 Tax=Thiohalorhabdus methylotrophus TaxID=3242694 RepID=A0ABV4TVI0_9GAMM
MKAGVIRIQLLGALEARGPGEAWIAPRGTAVRALLAYLLAGPEERPTRERLSLLLWPDAEPDAVLGRLRQVLIKLEGQLSDLLPGRYLLRDRNSVGIDPAAPLETDWGELQRLLNQGAPRRAVGLVGGQALADTAPTSPELEEWMEAFRCRAQVAQLAILEDAASAALKAGAPAEARRHADHMLTLEPWHEQGHRLMMEALTALGAPGAAMAQFESCRAVLRKALDSEPEEATCAAAEAVRQAAQHPVTTLPAPYAQDPRSWLHPLPRKKLEHLFRVLDEDGDGFLEETDFLRKVERLREPFRVGRGSATLETARGYLQGWWQLMAPWAGGDHSAGGLSLSDWLRFWWSQQQIAGEVLEDLPGAYSSHDRLTTELLFRITDRSSQGHLTERDFALWLTSWTPHLDVDAPRAYRHLTAGNGLLDVNAVVRATYEFKFGTMPGTAGDALFGLLP